MANLLEVAELSWRQLFPNPSNLPSIKKEEFIATARSEYAFQSLLRYYNEKGQNGYSEVNSILLDEDEFNVVDNEIDLSQTRIMRGLPNDMWLQNVGGLVCSFEYMKTTLNAWQLLKDDDCLPDGTYPYIIIGQSIRFPLGTHKSKLKIIYAGSGKRVNDRIEIDDVIGGIIRTRLVEIYGGKVGQEDVSNNGQTQG